MDTGSSFNQIENILTRQHNDSSSGRPCIIGVIGGRLVSKKRMALCSEKTPCISILRNVNPCYLVQVENNCIYLFPHIVRLIFF